RDIRNDAGGPRRNTGWAARRVGGADALAAAPIAKTRIVGRAGNLPAGLDPQLTRPLRRLRPDRARWTPKRPLDGTTPLLPRCSAHSDTVWQYDVDRPFQSIQSVKFGSIAYWYDAPRMSCNPARVAVEGGRQHRQHRRLQTLRPTTLAFSP